MVRLKRHYAQYEPTLQQLKKKYEVAMKEKMLSKLERDRAMGQVTGLQSTLKSMESFKGGSAKPGMCGWKYTEDVFHLIGCLLFMRD